MLSASMDGYAQPCAQTLTLAGADATHDIELLTKEDLSAGVQPETVASATITGTVTHQGTPGAGIDVEIEWVPDLVVAATRSDPRGHFLLCGIWNAQFDLFALVSTEILSETLLQVNGPRSIDVGN